MKLQKICNIVSGTFINEFQVSPDYTKASASGFMNDVLKFSIENAVLLTGLSTIKTVRTAEISNLTCLITAENKSAVLYSWCRYQYRCIKFTYQVN